MEKIKEVELTKIKLDGKIIDLKKLRNTFDNREWKAYILFTYKKDELKFRKEIEIIETKNEFSDGEVIIKLPSCDTTNTKTSKTIIGKGIIKNNRIRNLKIYINSEEYPENPYNLFRFLTTEELNIDIRKQYRYKNNNIDEYANSIFKIYYNHIKYYLSNFHDYNYQTMKKGLRNKSTAMVSYLAIKDYLENKYKDRLIVSESNVFIKNNFTEYDFLILKTETKINRGCYEENDIYAAVEIKTSGFFPSKSQNFNEEFEELIQKETHNLNVPLLYIAIHEGSSCGKKNKNSNYFYENSLDIIKKYSNKIYGLFVAIKVGNNQFIVPYDFNLDNTINEIINKKG